MISRKDVEAAWDRIRPHVRRTPVLKLRAGWLGMTTPLAVKLEAMNEEVVKAINAAVSTAVASA